MNKTERGLIFDTWLQIRAGQNTPAPYSRQRSNCAVQRVIRAMKISGGQAVAARNGVVRQSILQHFFDHARIKPQAARSIDVQFNIEVQRYATPYCVDPARIE